MVVKCFSVNSFTCSEKSREELYIMNNIERSEELYPRKIILKLVVQNWLDGQIECTTCQYENVKC